MILSGATDEVIDLVDRSYVSTRCGTLLSAVYPVLYLSS